MSKFKDMVARDNARTFMNLDEFAEKRIVVYDGVTYDGEDHAGIPVVLSGLKEKDRRQLMSDHIQGLFLVSSVLHCRIQDLGGNQPEKGTRMEISDPDDATRMNEQYGLTVENLLNVLPDVLRQDEKMLALATGVAEILTARPTEIEQNMLYQHIDTLPEDLLDQLAHDFGVSWWDNDWDIEQKRATFRESWHVRRHLGTKYAVELALSTSFGSGKVQEWFEYGGEPNHYRIFDVDIRQVNDNIRTFLQILEVVSRKSAVLDSIRAISVRELILYFGAVMSVTKKFKLTTGEVNTDIDIMGDEAGNALCDWDGGLIMIDKEATV